MSNPSEVSHPTRRRWLPLAIVLALGAALLLHRLFLVERFPVHEFAGETMGTTWSAKVVAPSLDEAERARIRAAIDERLAEVNGLMSTWDPESELSRFNRHRSLDPFPISAPTLEVFLEAERVSELSDGAFDVTVGPLVEAWGFGGGTGLPEPPGAEELAALRERVGRERLSLDLEARSLVKGHPDTECDVSAIAKGFGVDRVAGALAELGHRDYLVEIGGELRASGERRPRQPWRVAIEAPDPEARRIHRVIDLRNRAMATSGDYRNFYEAEGVWLSHLIDPRTAHPIDHGLASVTVLARDALRADALATALIVLGPEAGFALAERKEIAAYFIVREADGSHTPRETAAFSELMRR